jgi:hypothetical protein
MKAMLLAAAAAMALPAFAQDASEHVCVQQVRKFVAFRDPDSIKVVHISEGKAEVIDYANTRLVAFRFDVMINSKNQYGAYGGARTYQCYTSEDRRRVLDYRPKRD